MKHLRRLLAALLVILSVTCFLTLLKKPPRTTSVSVASNSNIVTKTIVAFPGRWVAVDIPICKSFCIFPTDREAHYIRRIGGRDVSRPLTAKDSDETGELHGQSYEVMSFEDHPIDMAIVVVK